MPRKITGKELLVLDRTFLQDFKQPSEQHALKLLQCANKLGLEGKTLTNISWMYSPIQDAFLYSLEYSNKIRKTTKKGLSR